MYNGQMVEAIDCTPSWQGLVFHMLKMYVQHSVDAGFLNDQESKENIKNLETEFTRMAQAADNWVEYQKNK